MWTSDDQVHLYVYASLEGGGGGGGGGGFLVSHCE